MTIIESRRTIPLIQPGDAEWDRARQAYNLTVDQQPEAIAVPADASGVAQAIRFARERGWRVAPQRTGHNAGPLGSLDDTLLLKTDALQGVSIDAPTRRARARAGAKWADLVPQASELGLAALHGSTPDVSIAGYSLGGGLGWYGRKHGLAANRVTAVELVTADGELRRVDAGHEAELFWALRGGGGSFGVVTALEFELFPVPELYAGALFFPFERAAEVLHAWHRWVATVPDELTSIGRLLQLPPVPLVPEPLRGKSFAVVEAAYLGGEAAGRELLGPLRELGPIRDTFALQQPAGLSQLHMDPPEPVPYVSDATLLGELPPAAIEGLLASAGPGSGSPLISVELRHLGGALARCEPAHGAISRLPGSFALFGVGIAAGPATAANVAQLDRIREALALYESGSYLNFDEEEGDAARFFTPETYGRLREVKALYDPEDVFRSNHPIPPAA